MSRVSMAQVLERIFLPRDRDAAALSDMSEEDVELALRAYGVDPDEAFTLVLPALAAMGEEGVQQQLAGMGVDVDGYLSRATQLVDGAGASPAPSRRPRRPRRPRWAQALAASVLVVVSASVGLMVVDQDPDRPAPFRVQEAPPATPPGVQQVLPAPRRPGVSPPTDAVADPQAGQPSSSSEQTSPDRGSPARTSRGVARSVSASPDPVGPKLITSESAGAPAVGVVSAQDSPSSETQAGTTAPPRPASSEPSPLSRAAAAPPAVAATPARKASEAAPPALQAPREVTRSARAKLQQAPSPAVPALPPRELDRARSAAEQERASPERLRHERSQPESAGSGAARSVRPASAALMDAERGVQSFGQSRSGESPPPADPAPAASHDLEERFLAAGLTLADLHAVREILARRRFQPLGPAEIGVNARGETLVIFTASSGSELRLIREREGRWWETGRRDALSEGNR